MKKDKLKVCTFGNYDPESHANKVMLEGLKKHSGARLVECQVYEHSKPKFLSIFRNFVRLFSQLVMKGPSCDFFVVMNNRTFVPLVWIFTRILRKPLAFNIIVSIYTSAVVERGTLDKNSFKARILYVSEKFALNLCDYLIAPTEEFKDLYHDLFSIPEENIGVIPVGSLSEYSEDDESQIKKKDDFFRVVYWGHFLPQHGLEYIIQAARNLRDVKDLKFVMLGKGQMRSWVVNKVDEHELSNVEVPGYLPQEEFSKEIRKADVVLGFFGTSPRAKRSNGNKVFEGLALGKPVITESSEPIERNFTHGENIYTVSPGNSNDLDNGIKELYQNSGLRNKICKGASKHFEKNFSEEKIAEEIIGFYKRKINSQFSLKR